MRIIILLHLFIISSILSCVPASNPSETQGREDDQTEELDELNLKGKKGRKRKRRKRRKKDNWKRRNHRKKARGNRNFSRKSRGQNNNKKNNSRRRGRRKHGKRSVSTGAPAGQAQINEDFNNGKRIEGTKWLKHSKWESRCGVNRSGCLVTVHKPSSKGSHRLTWKDPIEPSLSYSMVYDVRFERNFDFVRTGKLHGLGPKKPKTGGGANSKDGKQWSSRLVWNDVGNLRSYMYIDGINGKRNREYYGVRGKQKRDIRLSPDQWHTVTLFIQLNDPRSFNGITRVFVNGKETSTERRVKYRSSGSRDSQIQTFMFSNFYGGNNRNYAPKRSWKIYLDNVYVRSGLWVRQVPGGRVNQSRP